MPTEETLLNDLNRKLKSLGLDIFQARITNVNNRFTLTLDREIGKQIHGAEELDDALLQLWILLSLSVSKSDFAKNLAFDDSEQVKELKKLNEELQKYKTHFDMEVKLRRESNEKINDDVSVDDISELRERRQDDFSKLHRYDTRCGNCRAYVCIPQCTGRVEP